MITIGTYAQVDRGPVTLSPNDILRHTAVIGQSGSGKSYFIARLIEETVLRTRARIVILDPNGDFSKFGFVAPLDQLWSDSRFAGQLANLEQLTEGLSFDSEEKFQPEWERRRLQFVRYQEDPLWSRSPEISRQRNQVEPVAARGAHLSSSRASNEKHSRTNTRPMDEQRRKTRRLATLCVHWKNIRDDQEFLLDLDPIRAPEVYQAFQVCKYSLENLPDYPQGYGLRDLAEIALNFVRDKAVRMGNLEASLLEDSAFIALRGQIEKVHKRFKVLYGRSMLKEDWAPIDLSGFVRFAFRSRPDTWQTCVVDLGAAPRDDMLLSAYVSLSTLLNEAKAQWRRAAGRPPNSPDVRVPIFLVIDEAQIFAPQVPEGRLQSRVSDRIAEIAAEGRKYGLFLLMATQRPQKLRPGLLNECDNAALLRIQSKLERSTAAEALGIPPEVIDQVANTMQGQVLLSGRWVPAPFLAMTAPARTVLGGGDLDESYWATIPRESSTERDLVRSMAGVAEPRLKSSSRISDESLEEITSRARELLLALDRDPDTRITLRRDGIRLESLAPALRVEIPDLVPQVFGFDKFHELMQYVCSQTSLQMYYLPPYEVRLGHRSFPLEGFEVLPETAFKPKTTSETYRSILETKSPLFRLPEPEIIHAIATWLVDSRPEDNSLAEIIDRSSTELGERPGLAKNTLLSFVNSSCFDRDPPGKKLAEQRLTLNAELGKADDLLEKLYGASRAKLERVFGEEIDKGVLRQFIFSARGTEGD